MGSQIKLAAAVSRFLRDQWQSPEKKNAIEIRRTCPKMAIAIDPVKTETPSLAASLDIIASPSPW
jgi:hypothetical protein